MWHPAYYIPALCRGKSAGMPIAQVCLLGVCSISSFNTVTIAVPKSVLHVHNQSEVGVASD